jgi:hypothetical protein
MSDEVVRTAVPPASVAVPSVVDPSRNVTVPASVPGETVAVRVTVDPNVDGLGDDVRITDVATWSDDALEEELDLIHDSWDSQKNTARRGEILSGFSLLIFRAGIKCVDLLIES